ncbi:hypothetical protein [Planctomonas deserti]|uniref:hypothetical protein n=1 Tax=Planctomonas deserti TaxID=2144185 RepID=UPI000D3BF849|nr:hypothetical protein [Planctomonas deserti]
MTREPADFCIADVEDAVEEACSALADALTALPLTGVPEGAGVEFDEWLDARDRIGSLLAEIESLTDKLRTTLAFLSDELDAN